MATLDVNQAHQPISLPHSLSFYDKLPIRHDWEKLLTGHGLDPDQADIPGPPSLNLALSEEEFIQSGRTHILSRVFDVDSVLFSPASLAVFRNDVEYSFAPPFSRGKQSNQRIHIPGVQMTQHKCILICQDARWSCIAFFPSMPLEYDDAQGRTIRAQTQHLDDYALQTWTDQVVLPAFDIICDNSRRGDYPGSFKEIKNKAYANSETLKTEGRYNPADLRIPVAAPLLGPLWDQILRLSENITGTLLPPDAFKNPVLFISNHNLKQSSLRSYSFTTTRQRFMEDYNTRWNQDYIVRNLFWLDHGQEIYSNQPGTTLLRKSKCTTSWAENFTNTGGSAIRTTHYPWALTEAGSTTVELKKDNPFYIAGVVDGKVYNKIKEQFSTPFKGHTPFQESLFELLSYCEISIRQLARGRATGNLPLSNNRQWILKQWQRVKDRISAILIESQQRSFGIRQEVRTVLDFYESLDADMFSNTRLDEIRDSSGHRPFFILSTEHVNQFRLAECNRWILCVERIIQAAEYIHGTSTTITVQEQQHNSLMCTAAVRILNLSLGCLDPLRIPSVWLGKRWVRGRMSSQLSLPTRREWQKRRGLELEEFVRVHGMAWIPHRFGIWAANIPLFNTKRYHHFDIAYNTLTRSWRGRDNLDNRSKEGRLMEFLGSLIAEQQVLPMLQYKRGMKKLCTVLAEMVIQAYNIWVIHRIEECWRIHAASRVSSEDFRRAIGLSSDAVNGLEVLSYKSLRTYLVDTGTIRNISHAYVKATRQPNFPMWASGKWVDRVMPLFDTRRKKNERTNIPQWMMKTTYWSKTNTLLEFIKSKVRRGEQEWIEDMFFDQLSLAISTSLHAILHYDFGKASTMAKINKSGNSAATMEDRRQQSVLERLKWMFPKMKAQHAEAFAGIRQNEEIMDWKDCGIVMRGLRVVQEQDKMPDVKDVPNLLQSRVQLHSHLGSTLASLKSFYESFDEYLDDLTEHEIDEADESDWPARPRDQGSSDSEDSDTEDSESNLSSYDDND